MQVLFCNIFSPLQVYAHLKRTGYIVLRRSVKWLANNNISVNGYHYWLIVAQRHTCTIS